MATRLIASGIGLALALALAADAAGQGRQTGTIRGAAVDSLGALVTRRHRHGRIAVPAGDTHSGAGA